MGSRCRPPKGSPVSRGGAVEIIGLAGDVLELLGAGLIVVGVITLEAEGRWPWQAQGEP